MRKILFLKYVQKVQYVHWFAPTCIEIGKANWLNCRYQYFEFMTFSIISNVDNWVSNQHYQKDIHLRPNWDQLQKMQNSKASGWESNPRPWISRPITLYWLSYTSRCSELGCKFSIITGGNAGCITSNASCIFCNFSQFILCFSLVFTSKLFTTLQLSTVNIHP